ncbi:MAG: DUF4040 domain-containing protein [Ruminococcaceae bacterium]|nr:DUF4040 domain-containing protein [Oscillospiraceae bacterium]
MNLVLESVLLILLILTAVAAVLSKKLLSSVILFMPFSTILAFIWMLLSSPDLAITEAAVGSGITTVLFVLVLRRTGMIDGDDYE